MVGKSAVHGPSSLRKKVFELNRSTGSGVYGHLIHCTCEPGCQRGSSKRAEWEFRIAPQCARNVVAWNGN